MAKYRLLSANEEPSALTYPPLEEEIFTCIEDCTSRLCDDGCTVDHCPPGCTPSCAGSEACGEFELCTSVECSDMAWFDQVPVCKDYTCPFTTLDESPLLSNTSSTQSCAPVASVSSRSHPQIMGQRSNNSSDDSTDGEHAYYNQIRTVTPRATSSSSTEGHPGQYISIYNNNLSSHAYPTEHCGRIFEDCEALTSHFMAAHFNLENAYADNVQETSLVEWETQSEIVNSNNLSSPKTSSCLEPSCSATYQPFSLNERLQTTELPPYLASDKVHHPMRDVTQQSSIPSSSFEQSRIHRLDPLTTTSQTLNTYRSSTMPLSGQLEMPLVQSSSTNSSIPIKTVNTTKICEWVEEPSAGRVCGMKFKDGNDLQLHVDEVHLCQSSPAYCARNTSCNWYQCKRNGNRFQTKDKLRRHMFTHTGCKMTSSLSAYNTG